MTAPELLYGSRAAQTVHAAVALDSSLADDLTLADVDVFYALLEIPMSVACGILPSALHPSVPAMLGITAWRVADSPFGAFNMAWSGIACRTGIKPRHFVTGAVCDNDDAAGFFSARYGLPCVAASIAYRETYDRVALSATTASGPVLGVRVSEMVPLTGAGASVKYSPPLCAATVDDEIALVQFEAGYDFKRVLRGRPVIEVYDAPALGQQDVTPGHPVSATHAVCDLHLHAVRFVVDPAVPAERGGARRLAR